MKLFTGLKKWLRSPARRPMVRTRPHKRLRFRLEALEDRAVPASLTSDQFDYAPGATAILTASNFDVGETLQFQVTSDVSGPGQDPWAVTDGSADDLDGEANGTVVTGWLVDPDGAYLDTTLNAAATGLTSGLNATTSFTDSGDGSPTIISEANGWKKVEEGDAGFGESVTTVTCSDGDVITMIAIKSGQGTFTYPANYHPDEDPAYANQNDKHSAVIFADGTYDGYEVVGIGTSTVTVSVVDDAKDISHVDYFCEEQELGDVTLRLEGRKFEDINGNGVDDDDPGISGWPINITLGERSFEIESGNSYSYNYTTDTLMDIGDLADGAFLITVTISEADLGDGIEYSVSEEQQDGWTQTAGDGNPDMDGFQPFTGTFTISNTAAEDLVFGNFENVLITGKKFYDANANGMDDDGQVVAGFKIGLDVDGDEIADYFAFTDSNGNYTFGDLDNADGDDDPTTGSDLGPGTYLVFEILPTGDHTWIQTFGEDGYTITVGDGGVESGGTSDGNDFGNLCLGEGGGHTQGFWSNKNGEKLVGGDDLACLNTLNLRGSTGSLLSDFTTYAQFRSWLKSLDDNSNMAYKLSIQLAAMKLNVHNGLVDGNSLVYAPGLGDGGSDFITVNDLIAQANAALADPVGAASYLEQLKDALDNANNNETFVQPKPCPVIYE